MTLGIMTLGIMTVGIMTVLIMTLGIMTLGIMTLGISIDWQMLSVTFSFCHDENAIVLSVILVSIVALRG
jgi:hypothetical protein